MIARQSLPSQVLSMHLSYFGVFLSEEGKSINILLQRRELVLFPVEAYSERMCHNTSHGLLSNLNMLKLIDCLSLRFPSKSSFTFAF